MPIVAVNFACEQCRTENSVEVLTKNGREAELQFKCGSCEAEQRHVEVSRDAKFGKVMHQWVKGEEGWEQLY